MKINKEKESVICGNRNSIHSYFGWPTVARLKNGKLAMVASGFRLAHVCPFGKGVICYSEDEGKTWTAPAVIIDTPLDDRDCGIVAYGKSSVLVTSFNNLIDFQRETNREQKDKLPEGVYDYVEKYLDVIEAKGNEADYVGSNYIISNDNGVTWGDIHRIPITTPHGPCVLDDGSLLYVGEKHKYGYGKEYLDLESPSAIQCYKVYPDGTYEYVCDIEIVPGRIFCEPHAIVLKSGKIIVQLRTQPRWKDRSVYTIYQCESDDLSKGFTTPHQILPQTGGAPSHLLELSNGMLISTYSYRKEPYAIKVMFSKDEGNTWDTDYVLYSNDYSDDLGYPSSVELSDGRILTTFYATEAGKPTQVMQVIWSFCEE